MGKQESGLLKFLFIQSFKHGFVEAKAKIRCAVNISGIPSLAVT
jgi:hypothetical protein